MKKRLEERIHLILSIKAEDRITEETHIFKKVSRDAGGATESEMREAVNHLLEREYVENVEGGWQITGLGRRKALPLATDPGMNLSYRRVLIARNYYEEMAPYLLSFLQGKDLAVIKLFSNQDRPLNKVKKVFSRFSSRKPPESHRIEDKNTLMRYINAHTVEFLMIINETGVKPDCLTLSVYPHELDGEWEFLLKVVKHTDEILREKGLKPLITFSGDEGFNLFCKFSEPLGTWNTYQRAVQNVVNLIEKRFKSRGVLKYPLRPLETMEEEKKGIIFSAMSMRPKGTIIAPFSLHWRTCLASIPVKADRIQRFKKEDAEPEKVIQHKEEYRTNIEASSPTKFAKDLGLGLFSYFQESE